MFPAVHGTAGTVLADIGVALLVLAIIVGASLLGSRRK